MTPIETRERIHNPNLIIRAYTPEEEASRLQYTYKKLPFYVEHGYEVILPDLEKYPPEEIRVLDSETLTRFVAEELYVPSFYEKGLATMRRVKSTIDKGIARIVEQKPDWFYIPNEYTIALTQYGVAGSYDHKTGKIVMRSKEDGTIPSIAGPAGTPLHEMLHIGTEEQIVLKHGLTHREKERMIDLLYAHILGDFKLDYIEQPIGDRRLDDYLSETSLDVLPDRIEQYIHKFPRLP